MSKKLKIKFWKAEKALVMQILKQEGLPEEKEEGFVRIVSSPAMFEDEIYLRGYTFDNSNMCYSSFETNSGRDIYLDKITSAITNELFTIDKGALKVGEMCEVSDDKKHWNKRVYAGKSARELGLDRRYIAMHPEDGISLIRWKYARPLAKRIEPKVEENGEVITYTWEKE